MRSGRRSKGGLRVWTASNEEGLGNLTGEAILEVTILDDRVLAPLALQHLLALHLQFEWSFGTRNRLAIAPKDRFRLGLPAAAPGGFTKNAGSAEWVCI